MGAGGRARIDNSSVAGNDTDPEGNALSFTVQSTTVHGSLTLNVNGTFTYTPVLNYNGNDQFVYKVCDNGIPSLCATALVTIHILPMNDPPVAKKDISCKKL